MPAIPSYDDLPLQDGVRCSWGVWGDHDPFGTWNLLSPERTAAAARLVERGDVFPLNWSMALPDPPLFGRAALRHEIRSNPGSRSQDELLHDWNTQASTQWDGFRHARREGSGFYGGIGDLDHGVDHWARRGIAGRAVLVDVERWRASVGRPLQQDASDPIEPEDVTATIAAQGAEIEPGDILLLRTGWLPWYETTADAATRSAISDWQVLKTPGLRACEESARLLWNLHISAIATDNPALEVWPIGALTDPVEREAIAADPRREHEMLLHAHLLPMLGLPIGELFDLEALALDCAADGRYACFFTSAPINLPHGVASPPNALALK